METTRREAVLRSILATVLREVLADGSFDTQEKTALAELCKVLGIPQALFNEVATEVRSQLQADPTAGAMDPKLTLARVHQALTEAFPEAELAAILEKVELVLVRPPEPAKTSITQPIPVPVSMPPAAPKASTTTEALPLDTKSLPLDAAEAREQEFIRLVEESWGRFDEVERTGWIDDCFLGNVIASHVENGRFLLDITSDGTVHYLLFSTRERERFVVRMDHSRAEDFAFAKSVGHLTTLTLGYSKAYPDLSKIFSAMRSEFKSNMAGQGRIQGYEDPGVIKVNAEGTTATAETSLLLDLRDYVDLKTLRCDRGRLWEHFGAVYQSLQKYLDGIMQ